MLILALTFATNVVFTSCRDDRATTETAVDDVDDMDDIEDDVEDAVDDLEDDMD